MKFFAPVLALSFVLFAVSCKSIDKEFLSMLQSEKSSMEAIGTTIAKLGTDLAGFKAQVDAAPEALKTNPASGYGAIVEQLTGVINKQGAMNGMYTDLMGKFTGLITDYTAGKVKTDAAKATFTTLKEGFGGLNNDMSGISNTISTMVTAFGTMKAAAEAAAATPAPAPTKKK